MKARELLSYAGPMSPWGPGAGGLVFCAAAFAFAVFALPPIVWAFKHAVVPWWDFWLAN